MHRNPVCYTPNGFRIGAATRKRKFLVVQPSKAVLFDLRAMLPLDDHHVIGTRRRRDH